MKFAPSEFWNMTLREARLVIKGDIERQENDFMTFYFAHINAIGACLSKNHKFNKKKKKKEGKEKHKPKSSDKLKDELDDLIKNWR